MICTVCSVTIEMDGKGIPSSKYWKESRKDNKIEIQAVFCGAECSLKYYKEKKL